MESRLIQDIRLMTAMTTKKVGVIRDGHTMLKYTERV